MAKHETKQTVVYNCGTQVRMIMSGMTGMITCVGIRFDSVSYEVTYFLDHGEPRQMWMKEQEFIVNTAVTKTIGFKV